MGQCSAQEPLYDHARLAEIDNPGMALSKRRQDPTQVPDARRPGLGDQDLCHRLDLTLLELSGQETLDHHDLLALLLREVRTVTLLVKRDRFPALLDHRLQHPLDLGLGDALSITLPARSD